MVKNLPATQETWVQPLGREDPLGKEMAYPLQYSCLENPMDRGVWQTTVHALQTRTRLDDQACITIEQQEIVNQDVKLGNSTICNPF